MANQRQKRNSRFGGRSVERSETSSAKGAQAAGEALRRRRRVAMPRCACGREDDLAFLPVGRVELDDGGKLRFVAKTEDQSARYVFAWQCADCRQLSL